MCAKASNQGGGWSVEKQSGSRRGIVAVDLQVRTKMRDVRLSSNSVRLTRLDFSLQQHCPSSGFVDRLMKWTLALHLCLPRTSQDDLLSSTC